MIRAIRQRLTGRNHSLPGIVLVLVIYAGQSLASPVAPCAADSDHAGHAAEQDMPHEMQHGDHLQAVDAVDSCACCDQPQCEMLHCLFAQAAPLSIHLPGITPAADAFKAETPAACLSVDASALYRPPIYG